MTKMQVQTATKPDVDSGVSLTIRFPLVLDPADRCAQGVAVRGYAIDTGEMLFASKLDGGERVGLSGLLRATMERDVPAVLLVGYDGDDGRIMLTKVVKSSTITAVGEHGIPSDMWDVLVKAQANPDRACPVCDPDVPGDASMEPEECHRECLLFNILGPHFVDYTDERPVREAALRLWQNVESYGLMRTVVGLLGDDDEPDSERPDSDDANVVEHSEAGASET